MSKGSSVEEVPPTLVDTRDPEDGTVVSITPMVGPLRGDVGTRRPTVGRVSLGRPLSTPRCRQSPVNSVLDHPSVLPGVR